MTENDILGAFRRAADDREHGAAEIEKRLLEDLLALRAQWTPEGLASGASVLAEGQPAMAPLIGLARRISSGGPGELWTHLEHRMAALANARKALAANAAPWIGQAARVVTISRSSAVAAVVEEGWRAGWRGTVVVLDGFGAGRGAEQALRLSRFGPALSRPDDDAPQCLDHPETLVAVGADAVGRHRFVNCIGTRSLLELAAARSVSTLLIADRGKDVAEEDFESIVTALSTHRADRGCDGPLFEVIPLGLVTARISD